MRKELSSFLILLLLTISIILGVLLINAKRELLTTDNSASVATSNSVTPEITTAMPKARSYTSAITIDLPEPRLRGTLPVESAIAERRSRREFSEEPVSLTELSQMLWAGQGVTDPVAGKRTAPSARNVYFYSIFIVVRNVEGLEPGLYEYLPETHSLGNLQLANAGELLTEAGVQASAQNSPVVFLLSSAYGKGAESMKEGAKSSALLEGGHIGQNLYLQAESLEMGTVAMAGFDAAKVGGSLKLDPAETIVYLYPFGHPAAEVTQE